MIQYRTILNGLTPEHLGGFFVGWPVRASADTHLAALHVSYRVIIAVDTATLATTSDIEPTVVGFINANGDGVATAFIPWLEVLPIKDVASAAN